MTDYNEMANSAIEIEINGKKFKARRPNLETIFGKMETSIISKAIENIKQAAEKYGLTGKEKVEFLSTSTAGLPKGAELQNMAREAIGSAEGTRLLLRAMLEQDQPEITDEQLMDLAMSDPDGVSEWAMYLTGDSKKAPKIKAK